MSYLEVYMEKVRDLLCKVPRGAERESLELHEDANKRIQVKDLGCHPVLSPDRVMELVGIGNSNRQVAETKMNEFSSRSHSIIQFTVAQSFDLPERRDMESVVWLVDLAGSERQSKAESTGLQLEEAKKINHSLLQLGRALNSFSEGRNEFLSLRESKLTRLLSECFGGNSKTWMLANVSPAAYNLSETISTLEYATNAKKITNRAVVNKKQKQLELKELRDASVRLELALDEEKTEVLLLQKRHSELVHDVAELKLLQSHQDERTAASNNKGGNSNVLNEQLNVQVEENHALREKIDKLRKHLQAKPPHVPKKRTAFVGRSGLSLSDLMSNRDKEPWKLRAVDQNLGEEAVLLVEAYPIDDPQDLGIPSSSPPPMSLSEMRGKACFLYVNMVGADGIPSPFTASSFCRLQAIDERIATPTQTQVVIDSRSPRWGCEVVLVMPPLQDAVLERFANNNIVSFEVFGLLQ